jgi:6,7-dimethyl-8-ribityllumazine synthase
VASGDERASMPDGMDGAGLRIAVIHARWNSQIVGRLNDGVNRCLTALGVKDIQQVSVPGCFEIPFAARTAALSGKIDAIVCIGAVIRGETTHYELVAGECGRGIQQVQLETDVPIAFGVLTVENEAQALARSEGPGQHNVGEESAMVAVEMARLAQSWRRQI